LEYHHLPILLPSALVVVAVSFPLHTVDCPFLMITVITTTTMMIMIMMMMMTIIVANQNYENERERKEV